MRKTPAARLWGAHAPRVPFAAPRRKHPEHVATLNPDRPAGRRPKHARRVRSPEMAASGIMIRTIAVSAVVLFLSACRQDMYNQPKVDVYEASDFFANGTSARPIPPHTVQYHGPAENEAFCTGLTNDVLVTQMPLPVTPQLLQRGGERYDIYCAVCHGATGEGNGEVVQRGFPAPPSLHDERLRQAPIGHFFDVITNGCGVMYSHASRVEPGDRWAIAAYIRALQLSQHAERSDLPPNEQTRLEEER